MQPQEKKWRKSIIQSLSLQSHSSPGSLGNWLTAQSLLKPHVHVLEPTLSQFPDYPSGCSSPEPIWAPLLFRAGYPPCLHLGLGRLLSFYSMLGRWAISHIAQLQLQPVCWWLSNINFFLDLCVEFLANRPIPLNIPQAPPYFLPSSKVLSPQPQPFLVKLPCAKLSKEASHWLPWILISPLPLLCQVSNNNFYCFYIPILSEIYPSASILQLLSLNK